MSPTSQARSWSPELPADMAAPTAMAVQIYIVEEVPGNFG